MVEETHVLVAWPAFPAISFSFFQSFSFKYVALATDFSLTNVPDLTAPCLISACLQLSYASELSGLKRPLQKVKLCLQMPRRACLSKIKFVKEHIFLSLVKYLKRIGRSTRRYIWQGGWMWSCTYIMYSNPSFHLWGIHRILNMHVGEPPTFEEIELYECQMLMLLFLKKIRCAHKHLTCAIYACKWV